MTKPPVIVIPAKPVPDPDRGAGIQTGSAGVPARILAPAKGCRHFIFGGVGRNRHGQLL